MKRLVTILALASMCTQALRADCYAHTIFVPRQIAYNPLYEDAPIFDKYTHMDNQLYEDTPIFDEYTHTDKQFLLSIKPMYTQTIGSSIKKYFDIDHLCSMSVQENGSGTIDPLWFQVISTPGTYYSSTLSFNPVQKTYGVLLYFAWRLPANFALTVNTAFIKRKNNMHICEKNIVSGDLGQVPGLSTLTQAFMSTDMKYGKICGTQSKSGFDDLQIKLLKNFKMCDDESLFGDIYALVGVPTGHGSKAVYLFEPIVGSNHVQF
jgi:hypothetical protein